MAYLTSEHPNRAALAGYIRLQCAAISDEDALHHEVWRSHARRILEDICSRYTLATEELRFVHEQLGLNRNRRIATVLSPDVAEDPEAVDTMIAVSESLARLSSVRARRQRQGQCTQLLDTSLDQLQAVRQALLAAGPGADGTQLAAA